MHFVWLILQLDVSSAFLHGLLLDEEMFIEQPQGFVDQNDPEYVCHLKNIIYGLKHTTRAWFTCLSNAFNRPRLYRICCGSLSICFSQG